MKTFNLDNKIVISILALFFTLILLGIAGNYDRQCAQEDAQIKQELIQQQHQIDSTTKWQDQE